jgi:hypothetical protein
MENFEQRLANTIQQTVLKQIAEAQLIDKYNSPKLRIPEDILKEAFATLDKDRILQMVREQIEEQIAKTIVGQLLTETATDTKKIMTDHETRQNFRNKVYPLIMKIANGE